MVESRSQNEPSRLRIQLETVIDSYINEMQGRRKRHGLGNTSLVLASILTSAIITIAGIYDQAKIAAILGVILSVLLAVQQVFPLGEMAFFYRSSIADLENLRDSLLFTPDSQEELEKIAHQFAVIRKHIAQAIPRGQAMNTLQNMRDELTKTQ